MEKNENRNTTSISLDSKSMAVLNNTQRVHAMGAHCPPPKSPNVDQSDIPDREL